MRKLIYIITNFIFLLFVLNGCGTTDNQAGWGSETTNGISGTIYDSTGNGVPSVQVTLFTKHYRPPLDSALRQVSGYQTVQTDSNGYFLFTELNPDIYNIEARNEHNSTIALLQNLEMSDTTLLKNITVTLHFPGTLTLSLTEQAPAAGTILYLPGTNTRTVISDKDIQSGQTILSGIPAGTFTELHYFHPSSDLDTALPLTAVTINSGKNTLLGPYREWQQQYTITMNTTSSGANIKEDVLAYPLLLRLNDSTTGPDFFSHARPDGSDLRFTKDDTFTQIPYDIVSWDVERKQAEVWVLIDTIYGNNDNQYFYMYTDHSSPPASSTLPVVFNAEHGYAGVWHFEETSAVPAESAFPDEFAFRDASTAGNLAHALNMSKDTVVPGVIGNSAWFNGINEYLFTRQKYDNPQVFAISLWFKADSAGGKLIGFENDSLIYEYYNHDRMIYMDDSGFIRFAVFSPVPVFLSAEDSLLLGYQDSTGQYQGVRRVITTSQSYFDGNWHQVCAALSPIHGQTLFLDGILVASNPDVTRAETYDGFWKIGGGRLAGQWIPELSRHFFAGQLDEIQIRYQNVSAAWVKLNFENQRPESGLYYIK
ncbi:MAG: DUF2341 domain-containing protein [Fibrobacteria bacterium]|nr:DUF2341 domain-containing protein [Fibrobacteria bacterium]